MKVLVTGSEGLAGSGVCPAPEAAGHEVVRYDAKLGLLIEDMNTLALHMAGCGAVVHMAAIPHPKAEMPEFEPYFLANTMNTLRVCVVAQMVAVPLLVHISSVVILRLDRDFLPPEILPAYDSYARSKEIACAVVKGMSLHHFTARIIRPCSFNQEPTQERLYAVTRVETLGRRVVEVLANPEVYPLIQTVYEPDPRADAMLGGKA